jgi:ATP-dependent Clp protease ATP-binding subunit ClpC
MVYDLHRSVCDAANCCMCNKLPMTDRARLVLAIADQRARDLCSNAVTPDHLLFALVAEGNNIASSALRSLYDENTFVQDALSAGRIATLEQAETHLPLNDMVERIFAESVVELDRLHHNYIGPEHLILALSVVAASQLERMGIEPDSIRMEVYRILGHNL